MTNEQYQQVKQIIDECIYKLKEFSIAAVIGVVTEDDDGTAQSFFRRNGNFYTVQGLVNTMVNHVNHDSTDSHDSYEEDYGEKD